MAGKGGRLPGAGRPKGSKSKTTRILKEAILLAAENAGGDGGLVGYLQQQALDSPSAFLSLLGKVLPTQVTGEDDGPVKIQRVERVIIDPKNRDA